MSGDFSRSTFDPKKHYSGVRMQQGRVQVDADWNEQVDIAGEAVRARTRDLVGWSGGPNGTAGFDLRARCALVFGGHGDLVEAPPREEYALRGGEHVTVEAVVAPRPGGAGGPIFSAGHLLLVLEDGGRLTFRHGAVGAAVTTAPLRWDGPRHVVVVYDGKTVRVHVDAEVVSGKSVGGGPGDPAIEIVEEVDDGADAVALFSSKPRRHRGVPLRIGGTQRDAAASFDGVIGSVRVLRAALSPAEVQTLRARSLEGDPRLVASFALDDGEGHVARDRSPLRNDAHLHGPAKGRPRWRCDGISVGPGRYYVGGVLCQNEAAVSFEAQPDLPGEKLPSAPGAYLAVLDVHERVVGALEDPDLLEVALGGVDTAVRTRTVWQVRLVQDRGPGTLEALASGGAMRARYTASPNAEISGNRLYRVEIHDGGYASGATAAEGAGWIEVGVDPRDAKTVLLPEGDFDARGWRTDRWVEVSGGGTGATVVTTVTAVDAAARRVTLDQAVRGSGGRLRLRPVASFKWSSNNGLDTLAVQAVDGKVVTLKDPVGLRGVSLRDAKAGDGKGGDWIEVIGDRELLRGDPGPLARVESVGADRYLLTVGDDLPSDAGGGDHASLRRWDWDRRQDPSAEDDVPVLAKVAAEAWVALERGIEVQLTGAGPFRSGEHWLFPARTLSRGIEWPDDGEGPAARPPAGSHRFARLARVRIEDDGVIVEDLRSTFVPLADLRVPGAELFGPITIRGSLHVTGATIIDEDARAHRLAGELPEGAVGASQLAEHAVTAPKLAPHAVHAHHLADGAGFVPDGFTILGSTPNAPPGFVYTHRQIEVENPAPEWRAQAALPRGREGRVVVVRVDEGLYALCEEDRSILRHDDAHAGWTRVGEMSAARRGFGAAAVGHEIHIVGGLDEHGLARADHEIFDTRTGGVASPAPGTLARARARLGVAAVGDLLFAVGGVEGWFSWRLRDFLVGLGLPRSLFHPRTSSDAVEVYDRRRRRWHSLPPMPTARHDAGVGVLYDRIHVVGGRSQGLFGPPDVVREHEVLTPARRLWETRMPLGTPRAELGVAVVEGRLYASGGLGPDGLLASVEAYTPVGDTWRAAAALPAPRHQHGSAGLFGDVFVVGGRAAKGHPAGADACAMASTLFLHRRVAPGGHSPALALPAPSPAPALAARPHPVMLGAAAGPTPAALLRWVLAALAIAGLLAALAYGYSGAGPGRRPAAPPPATPAASAAPGP